MKEKINIAELLKDCPKGTELYSPIFGNVYLDEIRPYLAVVVRTSDKQKGEFSYDGRFGINGECMLFPSKENRDWSSFQRPFKDGDIVVCKEDEKITQMFILKSQTGEKRGYCYIGYDFRYNELFEAGKWYFDRLATEEEKQKLFDAIKANGYKWNAKTKTLEKLIKPKFKVGDRVKHKSLDIIYTLKEVTTTLYYTDKQSIFFEHQDNWEMVEKFDITTLIPFESKVLVRSSIDGIWKPAVFGFRNGYNDNAFYIVGGSCWKQCIPYEGNEHLLGKTNNCDEYFKTWE